MFFGFFALLRMTGTLLTFFETCGFDYGFEGFYIIYSQIT